MASGSNPVQVVLLLEPGVPADLGGSGAQPLEPVSRNGVGDDDPSSGTAAEAVLHRGELVVERVGGGNPQGAGDEGELVAPASTSSGSAISAVSGRWRS